MNRSIDSLRFRPLQHPEFFEYYKLASMNPWTVFELDFLKDKQDWINEMNDGEKAAFTRGLTNFTLAENVIGDYWSNVPAQEFDAPEIIMMARKFSDQESNHLVAYNQIEENFDLDTFEQFKADEDARKKIENLLDLRKSNLLTSLAVFSGAVEGCSLFAIFALFVLFCRNNKMKTVKEILGWSAIDEELHSTAGIDLFLKFNKKGLTDELVHDILSGFDAVVANEEDFIDYVLPEDLPVAKAQDLKNYLRIRANRKLGALGIHHYQYELIGDVSKANEIDRMMLTLVKGKSNSDFFAGKLSDSYTAKITQNFKVLDYTSKRNLYNDFVMM